MKAVWVSLRHSKKESLAGFLGNLNCFEYCEVSSSWQLGSFCAVT